jgi:hypothetical protein
MGLRTFVALPVDKEGKVIRLTAEHVEDTDKLTISTAYGINADQTLLLGLPFRLSQSGSHRLGDVSVLYRHIVWQEDRLSGTNRLGLLGGIIIPVDNNRAFAAQTGLVFTHVKNRHEIDIDALYQAGIDNRPESARYDLPGNIVFFRLNTLSGD